MVLIRSLRWLPATLLAASLLSACAAAPRYRAQPVASSSAPAPAEPAVVLRGVASYYHDSLHGRTTASGQPYDRSRLTAAHRSLPFGTKLRVTNRDNGRAVEVTVNDRGPFVKGRVLDLSRAAAARLDFLREGLADVEIVVLD